MGRHSSIYDTDLNFDGHYKLGYERNSNLDAQARHSVSAFDFNFGGSMSWGGSTYTIGPSTYIDSQSGADFVGHMGEGTSNSMVEDDNEGIAEEEDEAEEEDVVHVIDKLELDPNPIQ
ncbi:hypothetical protein J1N35_044456 [Gossypium stocksii]|uniref:Uncharacterized protein n=1 Tax=Gossypium stocksii TaxID=47602 RepID=A0A9D3U985_9ROSI|nr:hypothetical protein J1N35_044456 [Gossypium stocksii]